MRPRGKLGEVALALCAVATQPDTVRAHAARAGVGFASARYTASRLIDSGELVVVHAGRPTQVVHRAAAELGRADASAGPDATAELEAALRSVWG